MRSIDDFIEEAHGSNTARNRSRYWIMLLSMGLANMGDATELGCMGFLLTDSDFEQSILRGDISKYGAMFTGSIFAGMLFGGIFTGAFGDQQGRRPTLLLGLTLNSIAGFSAALASNVFIMCLCRFLSGLGIGAILASLIPLATELSPTSKRGAYITLINGFLPIGGLMVGGLAMFMLTKWEMSWRLFVGACSVPSFLGLMLVYLFVPESPRYLALAGRFEEAAKQANSVARAMGFDGTMLQTTELEHHYLHSNEGNDNRGYRKTFSEALEEATNGLKDLYSPSLRTSTISLQVLWFCIGSGSGFGTWLLPIFEEVHINRVYLTLFLYWLANVPGLFTAAVFIDKLGRKKVLITSLICAGICMLFFAGAVHVGAEDSDLGVTVTSFMYHICFVIAFTANGVISSETFPTKVRTTGLGVCTASARIAIILSQYIDGALISRPDLLLAICAIPFLFGSCIVRNLDETTNISLKDEVEHIELPKFKQKDNFELLDNLSSKQGEFS